MANDPETTENDRIMAARGQNYRLQIPSFLQCRLGEASGLVGQWVAWYNSVNQPVIIATLNVGWSENYRDYAQEEKNNYNIFNMIDFFSQFFLSPFYGPADLIKLAVEKHIPTTGTRWTMLLQHRWNFARTHAIKLSNEVLTEITQFEIPGRPST